jgi:hypothetical protein
LRQPLASVWYAAVVFDDEFNLLAGNRIAVLRHVELCGIDEAASRPFDASDEVPPVIGMTQAELDRVLCAQAGALQLAHIWPDPAIANWRNNWRWEADGCCFLQKIAMVSFFALSGLSPARRYGV